MKIFLSGVSCVGKSTIGKILAEQLGHNFFDLDKEKTYCFSEIKKDIAYFGLKYTRASITVDLEGLGPVESANKVKESLDQFKNKD